MSPLKSIPNGSCFTAFGQAFIVVNDGADKNVVALDIAPVSTVPGWAFIEKELEPRYNAFERPIKNRLLSHTPSSVPSWEAIEEFGGIILYKDSYNQVLFHEEVLSLKQAANNEGTQLPLNMYRDLEVIRFDHRNRSVEYLNETRHVNSLVFSSSDLPEVTTVHCFPYSNTPALSPGFPSARVEPFPVPIPAEFNQLTRKILDKHREQLKTQAISESTNRVMSLSQNPSETSLTYLQGIDPVFEDLLVRYRAQAELLENLESMIVAWSTAASIHNHELGKLLNHSKLASLPELATEILERAKETPLNPSLINLAASINKLSDELRIFEPFELKRQFQIRVFTGSEVPGSVTLQAANIIKEKTKADSNLIDKNRSGRISTDKYDQAYIKKVLAQGAQLLCFENSQGSIEAVTLYYPPTSFKLIEDQVFPEHKEGDALYRVTASRVTSTPAATIALLRAAVSLAQFDATTSLKALISSENLASMKGALRDRFVNTGKVITRRADDGTFIRQHLWRMPTHPLARSIPGFSSPGSRKEIKQYSELVKQLGAGYLHATDEERRLMKFFASINPLAPFTRLSLGVASMTPEATAQLNNLITQGTFDGFRGVLCTAATREAKKHGDGTWNILERGAHPFIGALVRKLDSKATVVGLATSDTADSAWGRYIQIETKSGELETFAIAATTTEDGSSIDIVDQRLFPTILCPVSIPRNAIDNLGS
ncbi:MAG: hypothetical protein KDD62_09515, partial [Bdellovibrionales bacterium]|nr:hypothetical protein [Bdellovibrionales bacterium]